MSIRVRTMPMSTATATGRSSWSSAMARRPPASPQRMLRGTRRPSRSPSSTNRNPHLPHRRRPRRHPGVPRHRSGRRCGPPTRVVPMTSSTGAPWLLRSGRTISSTAHSTSSTTSPAVTLVPTTRAVQDSKDCSSITAGTGRVAPPQRDTAIRTVSTRLRTTPKPTSPSRGTSQATRIHGTATGP